MKNTLALLIFIFATISFCYSQNTENQREERIKKIQSHPFPKWFTDAKLGVFIHWGVYSVPSYAGRDRYAEWYLLGSIKGSKFNSNFEKKYYGENWDYRNYAPYLKAELFNPDEWAQLFQDAGAKYVVLVSKHHDGFCMWKSKYAPGWNSVEVGPKRDVVGELTEAVRKKNMHMGLYYSLPEWNNEIYRWVSDPKEKVHKYVDEYMIPQFKELVSTYKPSLIFSDGDWDHTFKDWRSDELIEWYYDLVGSEAIINDRWGNDGPEIGYKTPEYSAGLINSKVPWAEVRGLGRSFGLNRVEPLEDYMTNEELIHFLCKAVALGGGITINVGPGSDGQIPLIQQERLLELGKWLKVNGDAIYETNPLKAKQIGEKDVTLTRIDDNINFYWKRSSPGKPISEDRFKAKWTGYLKPKTTEVYTFDAEADDFVKVTIDGKLVLDTKDWESVKSDSVKLNNLKQNAKLKLDKNKLHKIEIDFTENTHEAEAKLFWSSQNVDKEIIPNTCFFTENNINSQKGLNALYSSKQTNICYTQKGKNIYAIMLEWAADNKVDLEIGNIKNDAKIYLLGRKGELPWIQKNGVVTVDLSPVKIAELPCQIAWTLKIEN